MSRRRDKISFLTTTKPRKDSRQRFRNASKSRSSTPESLNQVDFRKIRVVSKLLVCAAGLTESLADSELLQSNAYFGKYGKVQKTIINKTTNSNPGSRSRPGTCFAYVTYATELEASLAIIALDDLRVEGRPLKVSYGTTKYCNYFTKGQDCPTIRDCFYLHEWKVKQEILVSDENAKQIYADQMRHALSVVKSNLGQVLKRRREKQQPSEFPSVEQALQSLVRKGLMTKQQLACSIRQRSVSNRSLDGLSNSSGSLRSFSVSTIGTPVKLGDIQSVANSQSSAPEQMLLKQLNFSALDTTRSSISSLSLGGCNNLSSIGSNNPQNASSQAGQTAGMLKATAEELAEKSVLTKVFRQNFRTRSGMSFVVDTQADLDAEKIKAYMMQHVVAKRI